MWSGVKTLPSRVPFFPREDFGTSRLAPKSWPHWNQLQSPSTCGRDQHRLPASYFAMSTRRSAAAGMVQKNGHENQIKWCSSFLGCLYMFAGSVLILVIRRPGSACTVFFFLCSIQNLSQNPKSKIPKHQNPKSPKSKIPKIQNPPNLGRWGPHIKICYITVQNPKSKIPQIQNPKSKIPKIQNPPNPKSKIQNPPNPKSKIPKIQNPRNLGPHKDLLHKGPKSKIQNPQNRQKKFGFWILD